MCKRVVSNEKSLLLRVVLTCLVVVCLSECGIAWAQSGSVEHVFYVGVVGDLNELWWSRSPGWVFFQPFGQPTTTVAIGSSLSSFRDSYGEHVFFLDPNKHIHQAFWSSSAGWLNQDLTATGGYLAMAGSGLSSFYDSFGEHLFYLEGAFPTACVIQLYWSPSVGWVRQPLTCNVNGGTLTGFHDSYGEHVFYFNSDGAIHQLFKPSNTGWQDQHLPSTEQSWTPQDGMASFSDSTGEHVFYVAEGGGVQQLYWSQTVGWLNQTLPSGLLARSGASLTGFVDSHGESVFYVDIYDLTPHLLRWTQSNGWQDHGLAVPFNGVSGSSPLTSFSDSYGEHLFYLLQQPGCACNAYVVYQDYAGDGQLFEFQDLFTSSNPAPNEGAAQALTSFQ